MNLSLGPSHGWGFSLCGSQVARFPWRDRAKGRDNMVGLLVAVGIATLLAITVSAGYGSFCANFGRSRRTLSN